MDIIKTVEMNIKIVQDIKIEPINFIHDHFFLFFSKLVYWSCGLSARPPSLHASRTALGPDMWPQR